MVTIVYLGLIGKFEYKNLKKRIKKSFAIIKLRGVTTKYKNIQKLVEHTLPLWMIYE